MGNSTIAAKTRRSYRWSREARELVTANLSASGRELRELITKLAQVSGNPRDACLRFARQLGMRAKRGYREWPEQERQRLLHLLELYPVREIAQRMRRSESAIYGMLRRLGASATMGKDWFTKYTLAAALHIRPEEVQRWIDRGWLKARHEQIGKVQRITITSDDLAIFCKQYRDVIVGNRLNRDRLDFVYHYVFPPSHVELLPVREAKKEQAAFEALKKSVQAESQIDLEEMEEDGGSFELPA